MPPEAETVTRTRSLEVFGYWPTRTPCLVVLRIGAVAIPTTVRGVQGRLARAMALARQWYGAGAERVQVQNIGPDKREVLIDWRSSRWQQRLDEPGRRAANQSW